MKTKSRIANLVSMAEATATNWTFLTNHAQVLLCIADDPGIRLREIGARVGITERATHRIVVELEASGYVSRRREGRRNRYTIRAGRRLPDPVANKQRVGDLVGLLARTRRSNSKSA
jgi:DNA-binding MarR family transcriptional regulator